MVGPQLRQLQGRVGYVVGQQLGLRIEAVADDVGDGAGAAVVVPQGLARTVVELAVVLVLLALGLEPAAGHASWQEVEHHVVAADGERLELIVEC